MKSKFLFSDDFKNNKYNDFEIIETDLFILNTDLPKRIQEVLIKRVSHFISELNKQARYGFKSVEYKPNIVIFNEESDCQKFLIEKYSSIESGIEELYSYHSIKNNTNFYITSFFDMDSLEGFLFISIANDYLYLSDLPIWFEMGYADYLVLSYFSLPQQFDQAFVQSHGEFWNRENIELFWSGESFEMEQIEDISIASSELSSFVVNIIVNDQGFEEFIHELITSSEKIEESNNIVMKNVFKIVDEIVDY